MFVVIWKDAMIGKFSTARAAKKWAEKEMEIAQGDYALAPLREPLKKEEFAQVYDER